MCKSFLKYIISSVINPATGITLWGFVPLSQVNIRERGETSVASFRVWLRETIVKIGLQGCS